MIVTIYRKPTNVPCRSAHVEEEARNAISTTVLKPVTRTALIRKYNYTTPKKGTTLVAKSKKSPSKRAKKAPVAIEAYSDKVSACLALVNLAHPEKIATLKPILASYFDSKDVPAFSAALAGWKKQHEDAGRTMRPRMVARVMREAQAMA